MHWNDYAGDYAGDARESDHLVIIIRYYDDIIITIMIICQHQDFKDSCSLNLVETEGTVTYAEAEALLEFVTK
jgi:hypothetical protein